MERERDCWELERRLREAEERYRIVSELTSDYACAVRVEPDGTFVREWGTGSLDRMIGFQTDGADALAEWADLVHPDDLSAFRRHTRTLLAGEPVEDEFRMITTSGEVRWLRGRARPVWDESEGRVVHIHCLLQDITERVRTEEALRKSETRFRELYDHMSSGVAVYDVQHGGREIRIVDINKSGERISQVRRKDVVGQDVREAFPGVEEFGLCDVLQRVWQTGTPERFPVAQYRDDRISHWAENDVYKLPSGEIVAVYDDVTEQVRTEAELERHREHLADLVKERTSELVQAVEQLECEIDERRQAQELIRAQRDLAVALGAATDLDEMLRLCVEAAIDIAGMDGGGAYLVDETTGSLDLVSAKGLSAGFCERISHYAADSPNTRLVLAGQAVYVDYHQPDELVCEARRQEGLRAAAALPVCHEGRVIGCLNVASRSLDEIPVAVRDTLETMAAQVGSVVARTRTRSALQESEERLRQVVQRLEATLNALPDLLFEVDRRGRIHDFRAPNPGSLDVPSEELLGHTVDEMLPPEVTGIIARALAQAAETGRHCGAVYPLALPSGVHWFELSIAAKGDRKAADGRFIALARDVTERKQAEEALQQRNRELAELNAIVGTVTSTLALEQVLQRIVSAIPQFFSGVHSAIVHLLDEADGLLHTRAASGQVPGTDRRMIFRPGEGIAGWVVERRHPINVSDVTVEPRFRAGTSPPAYRSLLAVPLVFQGQVLGSLCATAAPVGAFDVRDEELLQGLAGYAAIAVQNARLYEQTRRDAETKSLLLREVNHRVTNNLSSVMGLLAMEMRHAQGKSGIRKGVLRDLQDRIRGLLTVHKLLSAAQWAPLPVERLVDEVARAALNGSAIRHNIAVRVMGPDGASPLPVAPQQATGLAVVINELVTNSVKHAFANRSRGLIEVRIETDAANSQVTLRYCDDGPGWPEDVLLGGDESVGLALVRGTVRSPLQGRLALSNEGGAVTTIAFRLASTGQHAGDSGGQDGDDG